MRQGDVLFLARCARSRQRRGEDFYVFAFLYVAHEQIFVFLRVQRSRRNVARSLFNLRVNEIEIAIPKSAIKPFSNSSSVFAVSTLAMPHPRAMAARSARPAVAVG